MKVLNMVRMLVLDDCSLTTILQMFVRDEADIIDMEELLLAVVQVRHKLITCNFTVVSNSTGKTQVNQVYIYIVLLLVVVQLRHKLITCTFNLL